MDIFPAMDKGIIVGFRQRQESEPLPPGNNGGEKGIQVMGDQDEMNISFRFLQRFQQGIGHRVHHGLGLIDDAHMGFLVKRSHGGKEGPELLDFKLHTHGMEVPYLFIGQGENRRLLPLFFGKLSQLIHELLCLPRQDS